MPEGATLRGGREVRRHPRASPRLRCWCEGDNVTVYARVGNLSEGGLFLRTSTPMAPGAHTVVRFRSGGTEVSAEATVVWSREGEGPHPAGMGLRFERLDAQVLEAIRQMISAAAPSPNSDVAGA